MFHLVRAITVSQIKSSNPEKSPSSPLSSHMLNIDEGDSQSSSRDSIGSLSEFDGEGDTLASQETSATEVAPTVQSMAAAVCRRTENKRIVVTDYFTACRNTSPAVARCSIQSTDESDKYTNVPTSSINVPAK